jgi:Ca2+-binding EF-hand superfamily protein
MAENIRQITQTTDDCTVSKTQLLRFFEAKFQQADRDQDGRLNVAELGNFLRFVTHPDLRDLRSWDRYAQKPTKV